MAAKSRTKGVPKKAFSAFFEFGDADGWRALGDEDLERVHLGIVGGAIPSNVLRDFRMSTGLTIEEMASVIGVSPRTVGRKEKTTDGLTASEADRAMRLTHVVHAAADAIGDLRKAVRWLRKSNVALGGHVPLRLIESEPGTQLVLAALNRIAYGGVV
jgi:putative toxin-antitoxin system antitoxin component (TIGR02293 family)